ncbi:MAG TPA: carotenoid biosynthesis protein [Chthoniobacteraceae bacterium]|nr:carotenoid biosynthesis protein [Chthoniobacteraceae bacterium]
MPRAPSFLARSLEPLVGSLWMFFIVWSAILAALWLGLEQWLPAIPDRGLRAAALLVSGTGDAIWLLLAAANLYLHLAEKDGLNRARLVVAVIVASSAAIAASSAWTGYPLGAVYYTARLGPKLGPVPLGWPMLWFVVVISGRELAARIFPRASHRVLALCAGAGALLTDFNLEPIATKARLFWFWHLPGSHLPSPPLWRNYACWFLGASALAWFAREQRVGSPGRASWRPALVVIIVNFMLILGHLRAAFAG